MTPEKTPSSQIDIDTYNNSQLGEAKDLCVYLASLLQEHLPESDSKVWHGSPVWFIDGNPVIAYSVRKDKRVSLMFFSGQSFEEEALKPEGKFKAAEIFYTTTEEIHVADLKRWTKKAREIQWDYKNIVKRKGELVRLI